MRYVVIADSDTVLGFRFAGVEGRVVENTDEARTAFAESVRDRTVGLIVLTDSVAESIRNDVNKQRYEAEQPLVVEIPGPEGPLGGPQRLTKLVREAVGIQI